MRKENYTRDFCKPIYDNKFFNHADLMKSTRLSFFEKICLWFIKPKYKIDEEERTTLKYKIFRGRIYVLAHFINPHYGYNCSSNIVILNENAVTSQRRHNIKTPN